MSASQQNDGEQVISKETTEDRSDADMSTSEEMKPVAATVPIADALSADYAQIAKLFAQLDQQVGTFTSNMDGIIQKAPALAGLTTLWEEQAKAASIDATPTRPLAPHQEAADDADTAIMMGDEGENKNDPLIFL
jgi:hypothetical protein